MSNNETRKEVNSISIESSHDAFLRFVNSLLEAGVIDSSHPFHEGAFATISDDSIDQRHVVIRDYNFERRSLIFHTDYRSPKIKQLKTNSTCSFLFYSKKDRIQLRFKCIAHVHHQDRLSLAMFKKTTSSQQDCYKYPSIPSASIDTASKEIALI